PNPPGLSDSPSSPTPPPVNLGATGDSAIPADVAAVLRGERPWAVAHGDGPALLKALPDGSLDAVITDPPYPRRYVPLYGELAAALPRTLKWGGSFLAIVPHSSLPQVLATVGQHLKYRWTLCMWQADGNHARLAMGIEVVWKPIVWWVNGTWPMGRGFVKDGFANAPPEKTHHKWEQSLTWAEYCLRFVPTGGVILDPLCGAGTTGVAAVRNGYRYIGVEQDPAHAATAARRLTATLPAPSSAFQVPSSESPSPRP
ncbi:MAG: DNA methyltransferase, partial [Chloroflexota bacterium]